MDFSDFRRGLSSEEFDKAGSDGRLYVFNKRKSDKDTHHIQKVQQGWKDDGKDLSLMPSSGVATVNYNLGEMKPQQIKITQIIPGEGGSCRDQV